MPTCTIARPQRRLVLAYWKQILKKQKKILSDATDDGWPWSKIAYISPYIWTFYQTRCGVYQLSHTFKYVLTEAEAYCSRIMPMPLIICPSRVYYSKVMPT